MAVILILDNYDSFTYNLVQSFGQLGQEVRVVRNDVLTVDQCRALQPQSIVISPGPGRPESAGISVDLVRELGPTIPVLGVCLGHQAIALAYGGQVIAAPELMHGKSDVIFHHGRGIFSGIPAGFAGGRYHSLAVRIDQAPELCLEAWSQDGTVMAVTHQRYPIWGIQFHPESILTPTGLDILKNFLALTA